MSVGISITSNAASFYFMKRTLLFGSAVSVMFLASAVSATPATDDQSIIAAVNGFHGALRRGDAKGAMELLAPDAVILESGERENREDYEKGHLSEDIEFSKAVNTTASTPTVHVEGNVAWVSSTSRTEGTFKNREVNSSDAELIVLTNSSAGWRIRAIHWSGHATKKAD